MTRFHFMLCASTLLLAACGQNKSPDAAEKEAAEPSPAVTVAAEPHRYAAWAGKWVGVEGMYATITLGEAGKYKLEMQSDLDTKGTYEGSDAEGGISFTRGTETLTLAASDGAATGLKNLAEKEDCLKVKDGEGYCRD